jgi:glucokinase
MEMPGAVDAHYVGVDVGGTKVAAARLEDGTLRDATLEPTARTARGIIEQVVRTVTELRTPSTRAVGIGVPSIVEFATGRIDATVNLPLHDIALRGLLEDALGLPVVVENDGSCAAFAEAFEGDRIVCPNLVMFVLGTGVGGGVVIGGRLYRGQTGAAAELGHMLIAAAADRRPEPTLPGTPHPASLEALASGRALDALTVAWARAHPRSPLGRRGAARAVSGLDAVELAEQGDPDARRILATLGERLGIGIANAILAFDPGAVVIGGGVCRAGDHLLIPARETARSLLIPGAGRATEIRLARRGPEAELLGAALLAREEAGTTATAPVAGTTRRAAAPEPAPS